MNGFSMIPKPDHRASQRAVDTFNNATAIGTPVLVSFEGGKERPGKVSSGNKRQLAAVLLGWRNRARHAGETFLNEQLVLSNQIRARHEVETLALSL